MRLHHHAIKVRDVRACLPFYRDLLGLPQTRVQEDAHGIRSVWLELEGDAFLAIERADEEGTRNDQDVGHHCFALAIEAQTRASWIARLTEFGHPIFHSTEFTIYVRDPEGTVIALSHFPEGIAK